MFFMLQSSIGTIEDKLQQAEGEVGQLRSSLKQYETLVDEYRNQVCNGLVNLYKGIVIIYDWGR